MADSKSTTIRTIYTTLRDSTAIDSDETDATFWESLRAYVAGASVDEALASTRMLCASAARADRLTGAGLLCERLNPYEPLIRRSLDERDALRIVQWGRSPV
jgi:hypothetical protein